MEDSQILALFDERSEQAIEELSRKYGAAVRRTAANFLSDRLDVEECLNDTWLGVWNSIPPQKPQALGSYVCRIARNLAVKRFHRNTAQKRSGGYDLALDELEECLPASGDPASDYAVRELSAAVSRFLDTLCYLDRYCFVRRYWYADTVQTLAAETGKSSHYLSVRLSRTRRKLQHYLKEEGLLT